MSRGQFISILGLYNYDSTLFDMMALPDQVDKQTLVNNIVMDLAELTVIYPDPAFMKQAIGMWSERRLGTWERLADVLTEDYDPFINIKRDEHRTITQTRDLKGTADGTSTELTNAYNSGTGTERGKTVNDGTTTDTGTVITDEVYHLEGDSAITDAQDVMKKEVEVRQLYDIYNIIIKEFKNRFCLLVY